MLLLPLNFLNLILKVYLNICKADGAKSKNAVNLAHKSHESIKEQRAQKKKTFYVSSGVYESVDQCFNIEAN